MSWATESLKAGFGSALQTALLFLLMAPVRGVIAWAFDEAELNWHLYWVLTGSFTGIAFVTSSGITLLDLWRHRRVGQETNTTFGATSLIAAVFGSAMILCFVLMIGLHHQRESPWLQIMPASFGILAWYGWPRTIHCGETAIWQRNRWGVKRSILYVDIQAISQTYDGTTVVLGPQSSIEHTPYHLASDQFQFLVSKRSGKPVY